MNQDGFRIRTCAKRYALEDVLENMYEGNDPMHDLTPISSDSYVSFGNFPTLDDALRCAASLSLDDMELSDLKKQILMGYDDPEIACVTIEGSDGVSLTYAAKAKFDPDGTLTQPLFPMGN